MKIIILYGSTHNKTKKIVTKISELLNGVVDIYNVKTLSKYSLINESNYLIFVSPTYGDAELQIDMENFLISSPSELNLKACTICETGNYDGSNFLFGAAAIIKHHLDVAHCSYFSPALSLDTLPQIDWAHLSRWCEVLNASIKEKEGTLI